MKKNLGPLWVALGAFLWSTDSIFRKPLTERLQSNVIVFFEHIVTTILSIPILIKNYAVLGKFNWRQWGSLIFISLGGSVLATIFFTTSFRLINPSVTILLQKTQPLIAIVLAAWILKERFTYQYWLYAMLAVVGVYLLSFQDFANLPTILNANGLGILFALLAAALWAGSTVFGRYLTKTVDYPVITALRFSFGLVFLFLLLSAQGDLSLLSGVTLTDLRSLLYMGLIPGFLALFIYYLGLKSTKAGVATIMELTFPLSAVVLNWIFLDQALGFVQIFGGIILLGSMTMLSIVHSRTVSIKK